MDCESIARHLWSTVEFSDCISVFALGISIGSFIVARNIYQLHKSNASRDIARDERAKRKEQEIEEVRLIHNERETLKILFGRLRSYRDRLRTLEDKGVNDNPSYLAIVQSGNTEPFPQAIGINLSNQVKRLWCPYTKDIRDAFNEFLSYTPHPTIEQTEHLLRLLAEKLDKNRSDMVRLGIEPKKN